MRFCKHHRFRAKWLRDSLKYSVSGRAPGHLARLLQPFFVNPDLSSDRVVVGVYPYGSSDGRRRHHDDRTRLYAAQIANGDEKVRVDWCP